MRIVSWNVNGIRAIQTKNFSKNLEKINADIICLQETKANIEQLPSELKNFSNYHCFFNPAQKKGYAGTAVYTKTNPLDVCRKIGMRRFDDEGRFLKLTFPNFTLINVYMPHGGRKKENMEYKLAIYSHLLINLLREKRHTKMILVGDFNIAHREIDLARPRQNYRNTMFTPRERSRIDDLIKLGFEDSFRLLNQSQGYYSWFPYGFGARKRNLGWRIDYAFISKNLRSRLKDSSILKKVTGSDHCPILLEVQL